MQSKTLFPGLILSSSVALLASQAPEGWRAQNRDFCGETVSTYEKQGIDARGWKSIERIYAPTREQVSSIKWGILTAPFWAAFFGGVAKYSHSAANDHARMSNSWLMSQDTKGAHALASVGLGFVSLICGYKAIKSIWNMGSHSYTLYSKSIPQDKVPASVQAKFSSPNANLYYRETEGSAAIAPDAGVITV